LGYVYRPKDILRGRKRVLERGLTDITPGAREDVFKVLQEWRGEPSMERLIAILGEEKAKRLRELLEIE